MINLLRYLQGERRGMGSQLKKPTPRELAIFEPELIWSPTISINTSVRLSDISFWQGVVNFDRMKPLLDGVIIRAGQRSWVDSRFKENWAKAKAAGIPRGSYWFYDSRDTPKRQAALWASLVKDDPGELAHACDFEESYGGPYGSKAHFKEFILEFQRLTGLPDDRVINYTGFFWWSDRVGNDVFFRRYSLWEAWYGRMENVRVPAPWHESELLFWQYTSSGEGELYGVSSQEIDLNWCALDMAGYSLRFGLGAPPVVVPPSGGDMWKGRTNVVAKLWNEPNGSQISQLPAGTDVTGDAPLGEFVFLRTPRMGYTKKIWLTGYALVPVTPPPPPPDPEPTVTVKHTIKVYSNGSYSIDDGPVTA
jgi:GH25 family lysozyme M1 (1,4-beta-N-acetylmuramidase)